MICSPQHRKSSGEKLCVLPENYDTSAKRINFALSEEGMISLRKISFLVREHQRGELSPHQICRLAKVSKSTFYRATAKFAGLSYFKIRKKLALMKPPGRPTKQVPIGHVQAVIQKRIETKASEKIISWMLQKEGIKISHFMVYSLLKSAGMICMLAKKRKMKKWVRWQRRHSLSLWQTDWSVFRGKWLIVILDDASRLIVGWGLFDNATSENSISVLKDAIGKYGKPKSMLTGRDVQFYASSKKGKPSGKNQFQLFLEANGIGHILARVNHPQTCGKVERIFGEIKTRIEKRHDFDSVEETIEWHNNIKPHMSLSDEQELITPAQAFQRKMHHNAKVIKAFVEVG